MMHILFPTDFTETSREAFRYTLSFAKSIGAKVTLMHAFQPTSSPRRPILENGGRKKEVILRLKDFASGCDCQKDKDVITVAWEGSPRRLLIEASKTGLYDLIAIGRSKEYDWLTQVMGSTVSSTFLHSHCPVLVIPPEAEHTPIENILIANGIDDDVDRYARTFLDGMHIRTEMQQLFIPIQKIDVPNSPKVEGVDLSPPHNLIGRLESFILSHRVDMIVLAAEESSFSQRLFDRSAINRYIISANRPVLVFNRRMFGSHKEGKFSRLEGESRERDQHQLAM